MIILLGFIIVIGAIGMWRFRMKTQRLEKEIDRIKSRTRIYG